MLLQIELLWQLLLHRRVPGESRSHVLRRTDVTGSPVREVASYPNMNHFKPITFTIKLQQPF
jgi:hypothetical protein